MKLMRRMIRLARRSRAPYGARGLKPRLQSVLRFRQLPRPVRGAWVETWFICLRNSPRVSRAPYGARGLKPLE